MHVLAKHRQLLWRFREARQQLTMKTAVTSPFYEQHAMLHARCNNSAMPADGLRQSLFGCARGLMVASIAWCSGGRWYGMTSHHKATTLLRVCTHAH
jgi:hypothetical protein